MYMWHCMERWAGRARCACRLYLHVLLYLSGVLTLCLCRAVLGLFHVMLMLMLMLILCSPGMLIFGGVSAGLSSIDQLWLYNMTTRTWKQLASAPHKRSQHAAVWVCQPTKTKQSVESDAEAEG